MVVQYQGSLYDTPSWASFLVLDPGDVFPTAWEFRPIFSVAKNCYVCNSITGKSRYKVLDKPLPIGTYDTLMEIK